MPSAHRLSVGEGGRERCRLSGLLNQTYRSVARRAASFEDALRLLPTSCDRRGARIGVGLARARLATGDGDEALRLAAAALITFAARGSVAGVHEVRGLRGEFALAGLTGAAAALDESARALGRLAR